ncbi:virulence factor TspB C-terminal domain-related protein [Snodgrassella communis]|uniref:virulence factor TspB C-terminal domain-related protein n=1 Tax=Snodgrassella communis TaxID=2946699 RepID=UPI002147FB71|nr:virulence factor TspB C-terminal domain-related protein [Snodgrassella communis]
MGSSAPSKPTDSNSANSNNSTNLDKNEFCSLYPNAIACMPAGVDSYEDLSIPEQSVDLSFKPLTAFSADGTCPAPEQLNLLGNHYEVSYNYACETMRRIRPIVIACAMVVAMFIVYGALKGN